MQEQARRLSQPLPWGRREKTAVAAVLSCLVLGLGALGVYAATSGSPARADCVSVTFASTLGGAELHGCGAQGRRICASGDFPHLTAQLRSACARAGFAFRPHA